VRIAESLLACGAPFSFAFPGYSVDSDALRPMPVERGFCLVSVVCALLDLFVTDLALFTAELDVLNELAAVSAVTTSPNSVVSAEVCAPLEAVPVLSGCKVTFPDFLSASSSVPAWMHKMQQKTHSVINNDR
jgi:hypothetical protein